MGEEKLDCNAQSVVIKNAGRKADALRFEAEFSGPRRPNSISLTLLALKGRYGETGEVREGQTTVEIPLRKTKQKRIYTEIAGYRLFYKDVLPDSCAFDNLKPQIRITDCPAD